MRGNERMRGGGGGGKEEAKTRDALGAENTSYGSYTCKRC